MPRAANNQLVFGSVALPSEIVDPDACNDSLDPGVKQDYLNLFHRLPGLPRDGGYRLLAHGTVNQDGMHPMIGETAVAGMGVQRLLGAASVAPPSARSTRGRSPASR